MIKTETTRIITKSGCAAWFDDLLHATLRSYIMLLTNSFSSDESTLLAEGAHKQVKSEEFIHLCYVESARNIYNNPFLFWEQLPALELKRNQRDTYELIKSSILEAIRKILPLKQIVKEYLNKELSAF